MDCKICGQHLEDRMLYLDHLKGHFESDPSKIWQECHCGHKSNGSESFVAHLCGSHGYPHYLHCNQMYDGSLCDFSASTKTNMKKHLRRIHRIGNEVTNGRKRQTMEPTNVELRQRRGLKRKRIEHESESERNQNRSKMQKLDPKCDAPYHCHLCSKKYTLRKSLVEHFKDKHEKKTGKFQCDVCQRRFDRQSRWLHHQEQTGHGSVSTEISENEENPVSNDSRSSSAVTTPSQHSQGDDPKQRLSVIHWKDYYVVSVDCKLCGEHFEDSKLYYDHLKDHFDSDPSKTWRECDCGRKWKDARFVPHLCGSHGYPHIFQCNRTRDGSPCDFTSSTKSNMKQHLGSVHGIGNGNGAIQLFSRKSKRWTDEEVKTLRLLKQRGQSNEKIGNELNRSAEGIRGKWRDLQLQKNDDRNEDDQNAIDTL